MGNSLEVKWLGLWIPLQGTKILVLCGMANKKIKSLKNNKVHRAEGCNRGRNTAEWKDKEDTWEVERQGRLHNRNNGIVNFKY